MDGIHNAEIPSFHVQLQNEIVHRNVVTLEAQRVLDRTKHRTCTQRGIAFSIHFANGSNHIEIIALGNRDVHKIPDRGQLKGAH